VHDESGITRDRTYRTAMWDSYNFQVVDTGGIVFEDTEDFFASKLSTYYTALLENILTTTTTNYYILEKINEQSLYALAEASAAIMVVFLLLLSY
jgi:predicted GTPase